MIKIYLQNDIFTSQFSKPQMLSKLFEGTVKATEAILSLSIKYAKEDIEFHKGEIAKEKTGILESIKDDVLTFNDKEKEEYIEKHFQFNSRDSIIKHNKIIKSKQDKVDKAIQALTNRTYTIRDYKVKARIIKLIHVSKVKDIKTKYTYEVQIESKNYRKILDKII